MVTVIDKINDGSYDKHLPQIDAAVRQRMRALAERERANNLVELVPGTKVRLKNLRPKYLNGAEGTVTTNSSLPKPGSLWIKLDYRVGRYSHLMPLGVPANCLEKL